MPAADALAAAYEGARPDVVAMVPRGLRRVLDLGCSSGALGAALKARDGCAVTGVERDPAYAAAARVRLDAVVEGDLSVMEFGQLGCFDGLVCADVLEHLAEPEAVLARAVAVLEPGAAVVVSLPNVRHWETFWSLAVRGSWPRRSLGIFDRTHLRWFTLSDAWGLLEGAGLRVEAVHRELRLGPEGPMNPPLARALAVLPAARALVTYQHVLRARV